MNKEEFMTLVNSLELPLTDYYILGGGSLLLHGIRAKASDLDICVSKELFAVLVRKYQIDLNSQNSCGFYPLSGKVEIVVNDRADFHRTYIDGYPVESLEKILAYKKDRNLPKDQSDIQKIEEYLMKNKSTFIAKNK